MIKGYNTKINERIYATKKGKHIITGEFIIHNKETKASSVENLLIHFSQAYFQVSHTLRFLSSSGCFAN